ncbi:queuosine salvage protein isoform X3 [Vespa velutina]|uniref:queuosine salvage protein isoform X3 n=1 Tax=Vespa velutina TaxID=202808 RepID=UPI001FB27F86|nr:queuosine salvage protein isoform X3 [Vespa velutina]
MVLMPRESAKLIATLSKDVFIEDEGVKNLTYTILEDDPRAIDWIFLLDVLNFSFWTEQNINKWKVNGQTGYFALCAAVKRAVDEGKPIIDPKYYSKVTQNELEVIFRGDDNNTNIPLINERVRNLHQAGQVLLKKYQGTVSKCLRYIVNSNNCYHNTGTFVECVKSCSGSAEKLLRLIINDFDSFRDEADYKGYKVSFYKRAQILIGDIWACFKGHDYGRFNDIDYITMFADYRIPQVLIHFGAIRYSNPLLSKLQSNLELESGSPEEVEIRGCSIDVIERVNNEVRKLIGSYPELNLKETDINNTLIDHFLWDYRRQHAEELESIPFHKTRCIYY